MGKYIRVAGILLGIGLIFCIGRCFYMIACISCTSPPIKTYIYSGNVEKFQRSLEVIFNNNPDILYKFSRRDSSNKVDDGGRDVEIFIKKDTSTLEYGLVCDQHPSKTEIKLVSAFSQEYTYGGYSSEANGVSELVKDFDLHFIAPLRKQHIISDSD